MKAMIVVFFLWCNYIIICFGGDNDRIINYRRFNRSKRGSYVNLVEEGGLEWVIYLCNIVFIG